MEPSNLFPLLVLLLALSRLPSNASAQDPTMTTTTYCRTVSTSRDVECHVSTRENEPAETVVLDFTRERELVRLLPSGFRVTLDSSNRFLQSFNNELRVRELIDRESVCDTDSGAGYGHGLGADCSILLLATASTLDFSNKQYVSVSINVSIENVNEAPEFALANGSLSLDESMPAMGNFTYRVQVNDDDSVRFSLHDPTGTFQLRAQTKNLVTIRLLRPLDYESTKSYLLNLSACDTGNLCASQLITVLVNDANDNEPDFGTFANQSVTIADDTERATPIAQVTAIDRDSGANGKISYAFENVRANQPFAIDPNNGIVTTTGPLTMQSERSTYKLYVVASDNGTPQRSSTATITVTVVDANDHEPQIQASQGATLSVPEETAPYKVGVIIVSDADFGDNSRTECKLESAHRFNLSELKRWASSDFMSKYELTLVDKIDFDVASNDVVQVVVSCHDFGMPQRTSRATFDVHVEAKNEHAPRFVESFYRFTVVENHYPATVGTIEAIDNDRNAVLSYRIEPPSGSHVDHAVLSEHFMMDVPSKTLQLRRPLDREAHANFTLLVVAIDNEANEERAYYSATATVSISVDDENDNTPVCLSNSLEVSENREAWHLVSQVAAFDPDGDSLRFSLGDDYVENRIFRVNHTGHLFATESLDRENRTEYRFSVTVSDGHFSTRCIVQVKVLDENDNAPVWPSIDYLFNVSVSRDSGWVIAELSAQDADSAMVTYRLKSAPPDFVSLDQTGKLYLTRDLRDSDRREYLFTVEACDLHCQHATAQDLRLLISGERDEAVSKLPAPFMWNLLISIIIIVTTITVSCLLLIGILFLRKRIRKQVTIAREREQLRRSLQAATDCKIKLAQASANTPLNNPVMVSSTYDLQPKRPPTDFIIHQSIEHEPDCELIEHLKWVTNSTLPLPDAAGYYTKAPTPDYSSKYSTFVKYVSNSPEAIYADHGHVTANQLNGVTCSQICDGSALNVRTNMNDTDSSRSNSNNAENHLSAEANFSPSSKLAPSSSETKLNDGTASICRSNMCNCDSNPAVHLGNSNINNNISKMYSCSVHGNNNVATLPKKRSPSAMSHHQNQQIFGTVAFAGGKPHACGLHTFMPTLNRTQPEAVQVIDRDAAGRVVLDPSQCNLNDSPNCDLPDWYRTHAGLVSPTSPYSPHTRLQLHNTYGQGIYSEARLLPSGSIVNALQHQPMIPVKEFEGDEV